MRANFALDIDELDDVSRGSKAPALSSVKEAAQKAAFFEEHAVYYGLKDAKIRGIAESSPLSVPPMTNSPRDYQEVIEAGVVEIQKNGIGGPFDLVLGDIPYKSVMTGDERGYPLQKRIMDVTGGHILCSPAVEGGILLSRRGGDYEITVGLDLAVGYSSHDKNTVELFLVESFTFQVFEPSPAAEFKLRK
jgi:uncharacterized linocin/CFP29 family protein